MGYVDTDAAQFRARMARSKPKGPRPSQPVRYSWFDPWKVAKGERLRSLVQATIHFLDHHEEYCAVRVRARRAADQEHHVRRVEAVVCNLAYTVLMPPLGGRIAVKRGHGSKGRTRYDSPVLGKALSPLLDMMEATDFLQSWRPQAIRGEVTSMMPSAWFVGKVREACVELSDFGRDETEEVVILSHNSTGFLASGERVRSRETINYADCTATDALRSDVQHINAYLATADIGFIEDGIEPRVDPFDRTLRRRFVSVEEPSGASRQWAFNQGGRLYGGFWQNLQRHRRQHIRVNGEAVVVLDYSSMFTRLAHAHLGETPPEGDLYAIPELEGYRSGVKLAMNCFLFDAGPRRRTWPKELGVGVGDDAAAAADPASRAAQFDARLPSGWGVATTKKAILQRHPQLKAAWGKRLGMALMLEVSVVRLFGTTELLG